jgi:multidrug resistance efflux pump
MTTKELKDHLAALTREAKATDKAIDDLRADVEAAKIRTLELKQRSLDVQRRLTDGA